jgi:hypothetical protein
VLAGNRCLRLEGATYQRDKLAEKFTRSRRGRHTLRDLEQRAPLFGRQPPVPSRRMRDLGHRLLKSRFGKIFPPRLGIVAHYSVHSA